MGTHLFENLFHQCFFVRKELVECFFGYSRLAAQVVHRHASYAQPAESLRCQTQNLLTLPVHLFHRVHITLLLPIFVPAASEDTRAPEKRCKGTAKVSSVQETWKLFFILGFQLPFFKRLITVKMCILLHNRKRWRTFAASEKRFTITPIYLMPYIRIKAYPKDEATKQRLAEAINQAFLSIWGCPQEAISLSIEEVNPQDWEQEVEEKDIRENRDKMYILNGKRKL